MSSITSEESDGWHKGDNVNRNELLRHRTERLRKIVRHAYDNSPAFRHRLDRRGLTPDDIREAKDLEKLPIAKKDNLVDLQAQRPPFGGLLAVDTSNLTRIFQSPGPIYDPQGQGDDYWRWGEPLRIAGFGERDIVINTFSYHLSPAGFMFDDGLRAIGATVVPTGVGNTEIQVKIIADLRATGFVGTPSFLMTLLNKAKELGTDFTIKKAFVAAEPFTPTQQATFGAHGIDAYQGYGTADAGCIAFECAEKNGMHVSTDFVIEIVDPNTGEQLPPEEAGEVVVTLFDETYPLIRFGTGDISQLMSADCPCGLATERIAGFMGRIGDAFKVRGMFVHLRQVAEAISSFPELGDFVVEVTRENDRDFMGLKVETDNPMSSEGMIDRLADKIQEVLRIRADSIAFVSTGTLKSDQKIVDKREWR
ncbi:MAG: AMP-binding protein [Candidatus Poribacteria bacterium]|nr:AMP-binding protein [Candidatus Poribacteria bacterium]